MEWFVGILMVVLVFGSVFLWDHIKEQSKAHDGTAGRVMEGTEKVVTGISQTIKFIIVKGLGVGCLVLAFLALTAEDLGGGEKALAVVGLGAYGIYLLLPGSKWVFFMTLR